MSAVPYDRLLILARRVARSRDEAEDLVQEACLAAWVAGRRDLSDARTLAWFAGTLRNMAAGLARGAARRRRREAEFARRVLIGEAATWPVIDPAGLPPALARTARLVAAGCTRAEIRWLLRITDTAFRQRISVLRRIARDRETAAAPETGPPPGPARRALLPAVRRLPDAFVGSHDPDGHVFVLGTSQNRG